MNKLIKITLLLLAAVALVGCDQEEEPAPMTELREEPQYTEFDKKETYPCNLFNHSVIHLKKDVCEKTVLLVEYMNSSNVIYMGSNKEIDSDICSGYIIKSWAYNVVADCEEFMVERK